VRTLVEGLLEENATMEAALEEAGVSAEPMSAADEEVPS
jgi:hypothetical protein